MAHEVRSQTAFARLETGPGVQGRELAFAEPPQNPDSLRPEYFEEQFKRVRRPGADERIARRTAEEAGIDRVAGRLELRQRRLTALRVAPRRSQRACVMKAGD